MTKRKPTRKKQPRWIKFEATATSVCPVDGEERVHVGLKNRAVLKGLAKDYFWHNRSVEEIVKFRIIKPAPKKIISESEKYRQLHPARVVGLPEKMKSHASPSLGANDHCMKVQHSKATPRENNTSPTWKQCDEFYERGKNIGAREGRCVRCLGYLLLIEFVTFMIAAAVWGK